MGDDPLPSIKDFVCGNERLEFLCYAIRELDEISDSLDSSGAFTLFAPTDNAINRLGDDNIRNLFDNDARKLKDLLLYHLSDQIYFEYDLTCDKKSTQNLIMILLQQNVTMTRNSKLVMGMTTNKIEINGH